MLLRHFPCRQLGGSVSCTLVPKKLLLLSGPSQGSPYEAASSELARSRACAGAAGRSACAAVACARAPCSAACSVPAHACTDSYGHLAPDSCSMFSSVFRSCRCMHAWTEVPLRARLMLMFSSMFSACPCMHRPSRIHLRVQPKSLEMDQNPSMCPVALTHLGDKCTCASA